MNKIKVTGCVTMEIKSYDGAKVSHLLDFDNAIQISVIFQTGLTIVE